MTVVFIFSVLIFHLFKSFNQKVKEKHIRSSNTAIKCYQSTFSLYSTALTLMSAHWAMSTAHPDLVVANFFKQRGGLRWRTSGEVEKSLQQWETMQMQHNGLPYLSVSPLKFLAAIISPQLPKMLAEFVLMYEVPGRCQKRILFVQYHSVFTHHLWTFPAILGHWLGRTWLCPPSQSRHFLGKSSAAGGKHLVCEVVWRPAGRKKNMHRSLEEKTRGGREKIFLVFALRHLWQEFSM